MVISQFFITSLKVESIKTIMNPIILGAGYVSNKSRWAHHLEQLTSCPLLLMASAVWVAFDRRFSGLTPRTVREICGFCNPSRQGGKTGHRLDPVPRPHVINNNRKRQFLSSGAPASQITSYYAMDCAVLGTIASSTG